MGGGGVVGAPQGLQETYKLPQDLQVSTHLPLPVSLTVLLPAPPIAQVPSGILLKTVQNPAKTQLSAACVCLPRGKR